MLFFSKSEGGFYDSNIHGERIPGDVVEITAEQHRGLLEGQSAGKVIQGDEHGNPVLMDRPPLSKQELQTEIDRAAGVARERFVSPGDLVDQEYKRAEEAARGFKTAGYPASDVPSAVSSWASAKGWTDQQAADDIIATADYWYGAIDQIREIRLAGKAAVQAATADQREATAQQYIDQLNSLAVS